MIGKGGVAKDGHSLANPGVRLSGGGPCFSVKHMKTNLLKLEFIHRLLSRTAICAAVLALAFRSAGDVVVAEWNPSQITGSTANSSVYWGQTFTTMAGGQLSSIAVNATKASSSGFPLPPLCSIDLYRVDHGVVVLPAVATVEVPTTPLVAGEGWLTASFLSQAIILQAGVQYAFAMRYDPANNQFIAFLSAAGYPGGAMQISSIGGGSFQEHIAKTDLRFRVSVVSLPLAAYPAVELLFPTENSRTYQLQFATDLIAPVWRNYGGPVVGTGGSYSWYDSTRFEGWRFYRLLQMN